MEDLVIAEDRGRRVGPARRVDDRTDVVGASATSTSPRTGDTNAAISCETPRRRGLTGGGASVRGALLESSIRRVNIIITSWPAIPGPTTPARSSTRFDGASAPPSKSWSPH